MRFDTHVHSTFSPDGRSSLEDYARMVDQGELDGIGFSEHFELWPGSDGYGYLDVAVYREAVEAWKLAGYRFFAGLEVDYREEDEEAIREALAGLRIDFAIGSVHNLPSASISGRDTSAFRGDEALGQVMDEYARAFERSTRMAQFDVLGHPGVFLRHLEPSLWERPAWRKRLEDLEDHLARCAALSGQLLEVNTSGLFCARGAPCAGPFLLERYRAHGGRRVTLASDAHQTADLRRGFAQAGALLAALGFPEVYLPWNKAHPVALDSYTAPGVGT